jgi:F-type H+-transporting ATPase subunit a
MRFFTGSLNIFVPSGSPTSILLLIIPIELISYVSRLFSLAIRLFANMMSGHTLLIILFSFFYLNIHFNILFFFPSLILQAIFYIEIGVAFLQIYVFIVLSFLYLQDIAFESH